MNTHTKCDCINYTEPSSCEFLNLIMQIDIYITMNSQC